MSVNRLSGLAVAVFGLALLLFVIPANTETVDYGWMRPRTIPDLCAVLLVLLGILHASMPRGSVRFERRESLRFALFAAVAAATVWLMGQFGFLPVAPPAALVVMLLIGERRPFWLAAGAIVLPAAIWYVVIHLLERTLP
jgi:putative tricarboxylic transport membrane protein